VRKLFKTGIIFMALKGYKTKENVLKTLILKLMKANDQFIKHMKSEFERSAPEQNFLQILDYLKAPDERLLLVFDNIEEVLYNDKDNIRYLIYEILQHCPQINILLTSRTILGAL